MFVRVLNTTLLLLVFKIILLTGHTSYVLLSDTDTIKLSSCDENPTATMSVSFLYVCSKVLLCKKNMQKIKSHTCEGGAHLSILTFTDELEKQLIYQKKTVELGQ